MDEPVRWCSRCEVSWSGSPDTCWVCGRRGESLPPPVVHDALAGPLDAEEFAELWDRAIPYV